VPSAAKLDLAKAMLVALSLASGAPAQAEVAPDSQAAERAAPGVAFRLLLREYLEFRVGSQVTIRSNAGQVVITTSDPRSRGITADGARDAANRDSGDTPPRPGAVVWRAGSSQGPLGVTVVPERDRVGATNICLYVEGTVPKCGDLSEVAGQVTYTASNP
jgi:hypothetical protein